VGILAGFGAGAMISAVSFDLVAEADALESWQLGAWMLVGVAVFLAGDYVVERRFGSEGSGGSMGIVVGSVVDGVPESVIFGIQLAAGLPISIAFLAAVFVSNIPQALAPSADLVRTGWNVGRMIAMWAAVVVACGVASALGWIVATNVDTVTGARAAAIAAGGLLAMLTASLVPFAYQKGGAGAALGTVVGFCASLAGS
jgi:ZIP family zinc transporter